MRACGLLLATLSACVSAAELEPEGTESALVGDNGFALNGLSENGMGRNGLGRNGMGRNGLGRNGIGRNGLAQGGADPAVQAYIAALGLPPEAGHALSEEEQVAIVEREFNDWFNRDVELAGEVMSYLVKCACAPDFVLERHEGTGSDEQDFVWRGVFNRAPSFCAGAPLEGAERRAISACLAGLVNPQAKHVPISLRGEGIDSTSAEWAYLAGEFNASGTLLRWAEDGAFFGDIAADALYACSGSASSPTAVAAGNPVPQMVVATDRGCGAGWGTLGPDYPCAPIRYVGACSEVCDEPAADGGYRRCAVGDEVYTGTDVVTVYVDSSRLRSSQDGYCNWADAGSGDVDCQNVGRCGDGVCAYGIEDSSNCAGDCPTCENLLTQGHATLSPSAIHVPAEGGSGSGSLGADVVPYCSISHVYGGSYSSFDLDLSTFTFQWTVAPNPDCSARSEYIYFGQGDLGMYVTQEPKSSRLSAEVATVSAYGGPVALRIESCVAWQAWSPEPWAVLSKHEGWGDDTIELMLDPNPSAYDRVVIVTVAEQHLEIFQEGVPY